MALMDRPMAGWLSKRGRSGPLRNVWRRRFFVLEYKEEEEEEGNGGSEKNRTPVLRYFKGEKRESVRVGRGWGASVTHGVIDLSLTVVETGEGRGDSGVYTGDGLEFFIATRESQSRSGGTGDASDGNTVGERGSVRLRSREEGFVSGNRGGEERGSDSTIEEPYAPARTWQLRASSSDERDAWVEALRVFAAEARRVRELKEARRRRQQRRSRRTRSASSSSSSSSSESAEGSVAGGSRAKPSPDLVPDYSSQSEQCSDSEA
jgi:hypothetical protein